MKKTPLNEKHKALGARMVDYAGWEMPVQYEGIAAETEAVRKSTGIFDVSHMGEILVTGDLAGDFLNWLLSRNVTGKAYEQITYAIMCYEDGGVVDDLLVYHAGSGYLLVVNAANKDKDLLHLKDSLALFAAKNPLAKEQVKIEDLSDLYAQIAIQGPTSLDLILEVKDLLGLNQAQEEILKEMKRYRNLELSPADVQPAFFISTTGYTGERGYEIYGPAELVSPIWDALLAAGAIPCGLGSRDALRLEAGLPLYGHEMSAEINPLDAGMDFFVELKREFQGEQMAGKKRRKIIRLISQGKQIPRDGYLVFSNGEEIGYVSSGTFSPTLGKGIANALVRDDLAEDIKEVDVLIRNKYIPFSLVKKFLD